MTSSDGGLRDSIQAELNPQDDETAGVGVEGVTPARPADGAAKARWVDYVVALGADRAHVEGTSQYWSDEANDYVQAAGLTRDELVDLADRLSG